MDKLVVIDAMAVLHRAFHALPPLTTRAGEPINAVYGFTAMLFRLIEVFEPTHIIVAFDEKEPTFRHKAYAMYQATRVETDTELANQFDKARSVVKAMAIPALSKPGYEADDVIGTIANKVSMSDLGLEVIVVTGDRDILQLVNKDVKVYMPSKGILEGKIYSDEDVVERLGVHSSQIIDYKALVGDSSDNYPGVPGIGPKTATQLLAEYGTFDAIYQNIDKIKGSTAAKLEAGKDSGVLSKKLATIMTNVPIEIKIEDASSWQVWNENVESLFTEFSFRTLAKRAKDLGKRLEDKKQMSLL